MVFRLQIWSNWDMDNERSGRPTTASTLENKACVEAEDLDNR
jgi:hypothetical protein